jgi:hypothetical protein
MDNGMMSYRKLEPDRPKKLIWIWMVLIQVMIVVLRGGLQWTRVLNLSRRIMMGTSLPMITDGKLRKRIPWNWRMTEPSKQRRSELTPLHMDRWAPSRGLAGRNVDPQSKLSGLG